MRSAALAFRLACAAAGLACAAAGASAAPDLSLALNCPATPSEAAVENFLKLKGFKVANVERVRRQRNASAEAMDIEALDGRAWIVTFRGRLVSDLPGSPVLVSYRATVESPPPTAHDDNFEKALIQFAAARLGCEVVSTEHADNPASAAAAFRETLATAKDRLREAQVCDKTEATYSAADCAKVPGAVP